MTIPYLDPFSALRRLASASHEALHYTAEHRGPLKGRRRMELADATARAQTVLAFVPASIAEVAEHEAGLAAGHGALDANERNDEIAAEHFGWRSRSRRYDYQGPLRGGDVLR